MSTDTATNGSSEPGPNKPGLRPWKKGQSGNPHGRRPKGLATVEKLRTALIGDLPDILAVIVKNAKAGDISAARTILERILPPLKAVEVPAYLDELTGTLTEQAQQIVQAMAAGILAPGQASQILMGLAQQARIVEVDDIGRRLAAIEQRIGGQHIGRTNGHGEFKT